ncbi:lysine-rich nucleolar protein 1 [Hemicordylus capensis]|uniref:lysine-rich nucleolar protein 1 n=1 Tax=Hemicordylus capensis TaxID=884348 RepID=UPI0023034335|nr:lysine-rich nucleolar protein 1 [Hemicordylus capensis]
MAIKDAKAYHSKAAIQKKKKSKAAATGDQIIVLIDDDGEKEMKVKNKELLGKENGLDQMDTKKKKKKKKKTKSKNRDHPIVIQSSSDSDSIKETEKISKRFKKKRSRGSPCEREGHCAVPSQGVPKECQEASFPISKKCKRDTPESHGDTAEFVPKRKKKRKHKPTCSLTHEGDSEKHFPQKTDTISQEMIPSSRRKKAMIVQSTGSVCDIVKKTEELNCKERAFGCKQHPENVAQMLDKVSRAMKKQLWKKLKKQLKEKKPSSLLPDNQEEGDPGVPHESGRKTKSGKKCLENNVGLMQDSEGGSKVVQKRKIQTNGAPPAFMEDNGDLRDLAVEKMQKKGKKSKETQGHSDGSRFSEKISEEHVRKKKKNGNSQDSGEEPLLKKRKIKTEAKEGEDEIKVVAVKKGNCDEINIDKLRRRALQDEIDQESGKTQAAKQEAESGTHFGQWSTAAFRSAEQKTKFLRLLGGFKKGSAPAQDAPAQAAQLNMALSRAGEEKLQQNLQADFEKAIHLKQHRGIGLGFPAATQKRLHIEKYTSKSIKFED